MKATHYVTVGVNISALDDELEGATDELELRIEELPWVKSARVRDVERNEPI